MTKLVLCDYAYLSSPKRYAPPHKGIYFPIRIGKTKTTVIPYTIIHLRLPISNDTYHELSTFMDKKETAPLSY